MTTDPETAEGHRELWKAFENGDIETFRKVIKRPKPNFHIFEKVLSTPSSAKFIKACIAAGYSTKYINKQFNKAAINYAAESESSQNLLALIQRSTKLNLDHRCDGETPLLTLSKRLTSNNVGRISHCIRLLLKHGASPNTKDQEKKTALDYILEFKDLKQIISLIIDFVKLPELGLCLYQQGLNTFLQYQDLVGGTLLYELILRQLLSLHVDEMMEKLAEYKNTLPNWNLNEMHKVLLNEHIRKKTENALPVLIASLKLNTPENIEKLVEEAIEASNWLAVSHLIECELLQEKAKSRLLRSMIKQAEIRPTHNRDYQTCLQQLVEGQKECLNKFDGQQNTPLHYAVFYRNEIAIKELLRQGAKLGLRNGMNVLPIQDMDLKLLEEHFDYCITSRGQKPSHKEYEIIMNYVNFTNSNDKLEFAPIAFMAKSNQLRSLLQHPLITCFLSLKWQRLSTLFYAHFLMFILFSLCLVTHVILRFPQPIESDIPILIVTIVLIMMTVYMLAVDVLTYLVIQRIPRFTDIPLLVLVVLTCFNLGFESRSEKIIAVFAIMFMTIKLIILIGDLPILSISTHMLMLYQVTSNFLKCLAHYSIIVLAFGLCFYILLGRTFELSTNYLNYSDLETSFMKTLVMFSGEFDDNDFDNTSSSVLLIIFMFITMILSNLLAGLAVSDTQVIKDQVELNAAICRANMLSSYECVLVGKWKRYDALRIVFQKLMNIKAESSYGYLSIFPNKRNQAEVYSTRHRNKSIESLAKSEAGSLPSSSFENEDGDFSDSNMDYYKNMPEPNNAQENAADITSTLSVTIRPKADMISIDNEFVKSVLQVIKQKREREIEEQLSDLTEKRQLDIWNWIEEQKKKILCKTPVH